MRSSAVYCIQFAIDKPPVRRDASDYLDYTPPTFDKPPVRRDARASALVNPGVVGVEGDFASKYLRFSITP